MYHWNMLKSEWSPLVALATMLIVQVAACSHHLDQAIKHEWSGLDYDERMFNDIRARYIVDQTRCEDRRSRRAAYKLVRELEEERAKAIKEFLMDGAKELKSGQFHEKLHKIHTDALARLKPVERLMEKACLHPREAKKYAKEAARKLRLFLEGRMPKRVIGYNGRKFEYPDEDRLKDAWDEKEVDLVSDELGAEAVAEAAKNEKEALEDDMLQLEKMGQFRLCKSVDRTVFAPWAESRRTKIEEVLAKRFSSAKELRRELAKVHARQLALLQNFDAKLKQLCFVGSHKHIIHWMDTNFFERQLAVIKGEVWMKNKANGYKGRTIDFIDMKLAELGPQFSP